MTKRRGEPSCWPALDKNGFVLPVFGNQYILMAVLAISSLEEKSFHSELIKIPYKITLLFPYLLIFS